ncbi:protein TAPETUM DETERMINANT 1-like isoform X2 [Tasmannia lanceolata]|uniref:protein TAPETUM DETERMINANT 1-like isoform X2 n=1 Tax=Tasmannia lanceolata TaxID=3420 RepID=UPI004062E95D
MGVFHVFFIYLMLIIIVCNIALLSGAPKIFQHQVHEDNQSKNLALESKPSYSRNRKLMANGVCTNRDISISQSKDSSSGIPQYIVQIVNTCMSGCAPSNIHLHCGWFASARIVNPRTFKRLSFDNCLVNEGKALKSSKIIRFTYSNSFMYPLAFKSARFC